jgi:hypothetical protein
MTNTAIIDLLTSRAGSLMYPGDEKSKPFPFVPPMYRTDGHDPEMAEAINTLAKLHMTAIVHLIETDGASTIVPNAELQQLRAAAAANETLRHRQPTISCNCGVPLGKLNITDFDTDHPKVYGPAFIKHMHGLSPECAVGHRQ